MKHWLHGVQILGPKSRWSRFVRHPHNFPPVQGSATGGGGGGGVSAPSSPGGDGLGGGGQPAPSSSGPSSPPAPYSPPPPSGSQPIGGQQGQDLQPASYGRPNPELPVSPALQGALDGSGPGYAPNVQPNLQQPQLGTPGQPGQQQQQNNQNDPAWQAASAQLAQLGVQLPQNVSAQQGFAHLAQLVQQGQQRNFYADLGTAVHGEWDEFQRWKQQQVPAQPQQAENPLWNPPQFDKSWLQVVEEDPATGRLRSKSGYDPRYGTMAQAYADFIGEQQRAFWDNPQDYMWKMLEPLVGQAMQGTVQQSFGQYQEQVQAKSIIDRHSAWLYQKGPQGTPVQGPNGRPALTPNGVRFFQYVDQAVNQLGITNVQRQEEYAMGMLERDLYRFQRQNPQQPQPGQVQGNGQQFQQPQQQFQANNGIPAGAGHYPNVNGLQQMSPALSGVQPTVPQQAGGSLYEMMRQGMAADNVTDADIRNDMLRRQGGY
jgi:hypothetical protein